jgi:hypothetical protein
MSNHPVRQHWIPKTYLRAFCAEPKNREMINVYDLRQSRAFPAPTSLDKVALKKHFYTLGLGGENQSFEVENWLADLESQTAPILNEILSKRILDDELRSRQILANFVATLMNRTRHGLQIIQGFREEVRQRHAAFESRQISPHDKSLLDLDANDMRELFARTILTTTEPLSKIILKMNWRLLEAKDGHFITSEDPLLVFHPTEKQWGLGTPGTIVQLPISPKLLLWFGAPDDLPDINLFPLSIEGVNGINGLIVQGAKEFLFSHESFETVADLLKGRPKESTPEFGPWKT